MSTATTVREALPAPELLTTFSMPGLEVFQVSTDPDWQTHVFYNHRQAYDPSSRYVLLHRSRSGESRLLLCDLEDDFQLTTINPEPAFDGACFSLDGSAIWYSTRTEDVFRIRRYELPTGRIETVFEEPLARREFDGRRMSTGRWLSFSHDGRRLLTTNSLAGADKYNSMCVLTFDMQTGALHTSFETGPTNWNAKNQYAPWPGPEGEYLICRVDCHSRTWFDADGRWHCEQVEEEPLGGSEYLVDEEGRILYAYPVGRDRPHQNVSHHDWFGDTLAQLFHCDAFDQAPHYRACMMLAEPVPVDVSARALGRHIPGGRQLDLTRHVTRPDVCHICCDATARRVICDTIGYHNGMESYVWIAGVKQDEDGPYLKPAFLIHPKSSWKPYWSECIPSTTPDGRWALFNSDYPGVQHYRGARHTPQVFACRGFEWPE